MDNGAPDDPGGPPRPPRRPLLDAELVRGDARMNRAVEAKLRNPALSLSEAVRAGGFRYPPNATSVATDDEQVSLGQRKNQLNRRLRQIRQQRAQAEQEAQRRAREQAQREAQFREQPAMAAGHGPNMAVPPAVGAYVSNNPNNAPSVQGQPNSWTAAALQNQSSAGAPPVRAGAALQPQQAQPQQLHQPQQAPGLMGFLESQVATLYQQLQQHPQQGPPSMPQVLPQQQQPQQQQPQQQQPQRFLQSLTGAGMPAQNAVVVAVSGAGTNTLNQSTLNQSIAASNLAATIMAGTHASIPQPQQQPAPANSGTTTNGSNDDLRLRLALHFFEEQVRGVYQNAMQSAGYSMEEIQATSPAYQRFVQRATQAELERLQSLNDMKPPSSHKKE